MSNTVQRKKMINTNKNIDENGLRDYKLIWNISSSFIYRKSV